MEIIILVAAGLWIVGSVIPQNNKFLDYVKLFLLIPAGLLMAWVVIVSFHEIIHYFYPIQ